MAKQKAFATAKALLDQTRVDGKRLWELLARPGATLGKVAAAARPETRRKFAALLGEHPEAMASLAVDGRYGGYLARQEHALQQLGELERKRIPEGLEYEKIAHLRHEAREKLSEIRPQSLGQALRISGITPADITVLAVYLAGRSRSGAAGREPFRDARR